MSLRAGRAAPAEAPRDVVPEHDAKSLTGAGRIARIRLDGQTYLLRITQARRLILTK